ncbi:hypothetical protein AKJ16_DCAP15131 [Drosera capensis]
MKPGVANMERCCPGDQEWKERKAFQRRLIGAKKKLSVMEQQHVFHGLRFGEKPQRDLLAQAISSLNSSLLQKAVESIGMPSESRNTTPNDPQVRNELRNNEQERIPPGIKDKGNLRYPSRNKISNLEMTLKFAIHKWMETKTKRKLKSSKSE